MTSQYERRLLSGYYDLKDVPAPQYVCRGTETSEKYWAYVEARLAYDDLRSKRQQEYWSDIEDYYGFANHPKIDKIRELADISDGAEAVVFDLLADILGTRSIENHIP